MKSTILKTITLVGFTILLSISAYLAQKSIPFKIESLLDRNSGLRSDYLEHQRNFNDENLIAISLVRKNTFSEKEIVRLGSHLSQSILDIHGIQKFDFLSSAEYLVYSHRSVKLRPFFLGDKLTSEGKKVLKTTFYSEKYTTQDLRVLNGIILLSKKLEGREETKVLSSIISLTKEIEKRNDGLKIHLIGHKLAKHYYLIEMLNNQKIISPIIFLILSFLIFYLFKSFVIVFWVDLIIAISYCLVMITIQLFDGGLSPYSALSLTFVLIVSTSDLIHFFSSFSQHRGTVKERLTIAKSDLWMPCFLTSLTTAISFLTLFFNDMAPVRSFGLYCCFGSLCAFLLTFYLLPWMMLLFPREYPVVQKHHQWLAEKLLPFIKRRSKLISISSVGLIITLMALSTRVSIDDDFYNKFTEDHSLAKSFKFFSEDLKSVSSIDLVYPRLSYPLSTKEIREVQDIESRLVNINGVTRADSFLNLLNFLGVRSNALLGPSEERRGTLNFLKSLGILNGYFGTENNGLKTTLYLDKSSISEVTKIINRIMEVKSVDLKFDVRGFITVRSFLYEKIISNFITSFSLSFLFIFVIFLILFRSLKLACLALIPNFLPLVLITALMGLLDIKIEGNAVMLICIIMGVAVDDTIHFLYAIKKGLALRLSFYEALVGGYEETSKALIGTTMVFVLSFPCFLLSDLKLMVQMGFFIILALTFALVADFIILPALLFALKPRGYD